MKNHIKHENTHRKHQNIEKRLLPRERAWSEMVGSRAERLQNAKTSSKTLFECKKKISKICLSAMAWGVGGVVDRAIVHVRWGRAAYRGGGGLYRGK